MLSDVQLRRVLPASTVSLLGDLIRWSSWAAVVVIWLSFSKAYVDLWWKTATQPGKNDYSIFYFTARMIRDGLPMYGDIPDAYGARWPAESLGNLNPPHFCLLTLPLSYFDYPVAFLIWLAGGIACLVATLRIIWIELEYPRSLTLALALGAVVLSLAPFVTVASTGELTYYLLLPLTLGWRAARRGRWAAAGAWLGACASVKLFLLLFLPWLVLQRRWQAVGAFLASILALLAVGVLTFGAGAYREWHETLGLIEWWNLPMNASFLGMVRRTWPTGGETAGLIGAIGAALIIAGTLIACRRIASVPERVDAQAAAVLTASLLASPLGWIYYVPLLVGPVLAYLRALWTRKVGRRWWIVLLIAAVALYVPDEVIGGWKKPGLQAAVAGSMYFWALLLLWSSILVWNHTDLGSAEQPSHESADRFGQ
jgi:alpha-1,2-mannosyltransferase